MEIREREEKLAALVGPDVPVALSIRVVGQWVVRRGKCSRCSCHKPSTALGKEIKSYGQAHVFVCVWVWPKNVQKCAHQSVYHPRRQWILDVSQLHQNGIWPKDGYCGIQGPEASDWHRTYQSREMSHSHHPCRRWREFKMSVIMYDHRHTSMFLVHLFLACHIQVKNSLV